MENEEIYIITFKPVSYKTKEYFDYVVKYLKDGGWISREDEHKWQINEEQKSFMIPGQKYFNFPFNVIKKNSIGDILFSTGAKVEEGKTPEGGIIRDGRLWNVKNLSEMSSSGMMMLDTYDEEDQDDEDTINSNEPNFYIHVDMDDKNNTIIVYIDPISHWKKEHHLASNYSEHQWEPLRDILDELGLDSYMDSIFANTKYKTIDELKNALLKYPIFEENREFSNFIKENSSFPYDEEDEGEGMREYRLYDDKYEKEHKNDKARFYIYVTKDEDMGDDDIIAYIEPISHWKNEQCLADAYTDNHLKMLNPILKELQIYDCMESIYSNTEKYKTIKSLRDALLQYPIFAENEEFTNFIKNDNDNDEEDDDDRNNEDDEEDDD